MRPVWFSTAVFISGGRIIARRSWFSRKHCFSRVYFSSRLYTKSRRYQDERRKLEAYADREFGSKTSIAVTIRSSRQRRKTLKPHREVSSVYFLIMATSLYDLLV